MARPTPDQFEQLIPDPNAPICDQFSNYFQATVLMRDWVRWHYNDDGSMTDEFVDLICNTGCGGSGSTTTTTTNGESHGTANFTSAGNFEWVVPAGVASIDVVAVGGGGGGGGRCPGCSVCGSGPALGVASGGGSGERRDHTISVTPGQTISITVGAGGDHDAFGTGQPGGGSLIVAGAVSVQANGGGGGDAGCCSTAPFAGGAGGSGGSGGTGTNGNPGEGATGSPTCGSGAGGASVGLLAGAGSTGNAAATSNPGSTGAVQITW